MTELKERARYPKPGPIGGRLIREAIAGLRRAGVTLPLTSHILIATSAGSDSLALACLIARYGRRVVDPSRISLLHLNHGWRPETAASEAGLIRELARRWGVKARIRKIQGLPEERGQSWEDAARKARQRAYAAECQRTRAEWVMTAHHADDLAETVLWRLLTGQAATHGAGIRARQGRELRPLLSIRKRDLQEFLREERIVWKEDPTNHEPRFLRARMRAELMPAVERLFPRAVEHLGRIAQGLQDPASELSSSEQAGLAALFGAAGLRARRPAWNGAANIRATSIDRASREIHLSGGWRLRRERATGPVAERWVLEKTARSPKA